MVDIVIGAVQPLGPPSPKKEPTTVVEGEILNIRSPRQAITRPKDGERRKQFRQDPVNGRVLTVLVPNGVTLPKDLNSKEYKVVLRFLKK